MSLDACDFWPFSARKSLENRSNIEDDRIIHLEEQLSQARALAEEADRKYEEVLEGLHYAPNRICYSAIKGQGCSGYSLV